MVSSSIQLREIYAKAQSLQNQGLFQEAVACFEQLISQAPDQPVFYEHLVNLYSHLEQGDQAISCYQRLLDRQPHLADTHYNLGILLKKYQHYDEAIAAYEHALECGIERPEEVHLNMAVIYSDHLRQESKARAALEAALKINPTYISAMFNLANIYEEAGNKDQAQELFRKIIDMDPSYYQALARLGEVKTFTDPQDPLIGKMKRAARKSTVDISIRANLYYALGKALNDCGAFDDAFDNYAKANQCDRQTLTPYNRVAREQLTNDLIRIFSKGWFDRIEPISEASPIFICGMFRSGSTLTEQILASHHEVTAGGEVDFFIRKINDVLAPYPASLPDISADKLRNLAQEYLDHLKKTFPEAGHLTDKRPDNFLHLGLLRSLYPNARIIYTSREPLDNCLSVYFLRLGNAMNYATDLENTAHFLTQCTELMDHWKSVFGENIFELNYDDLVRDPRPVIENMLEFCGLDWSDDCLEFHKLDNIVKTASVWQVREPLYSKSSGRWRNFESHLGPLQQALKGSN